MLTSNYTEQLIGLQGIEVKNVEENENEIRISVEVRRKECVCPNCSKKTSKTHDYRTQTIGDLSSFGKTAKLILRKRRYACSCGKHFYEEMPFLPKYQRRTQRKSIAMLEELAETRSYSSVASEHGVSVSTVIRLFNRIHYPHPAELPEVLGIDEFKGNSGGEKLHCILTDLNSKRVIDILRTRKEHDLIDYFKKYDRSKVKYFISDMNTTYSEIAKTYFPKAIYVIDRYHWIRQALWAFEAVRKEVQKQFQKEHRIYFKRSRFLLMKHNKDLNPDQTLQVNNMLYLSPTLYSAYFLKEELYKVLECKESQAKEAAFKGWVENALDCEIEPFVKCAKTYSRWLTPILNSLNVHYSNGFTEGCNNKIKVLKRNAFGFQNYKRFRNRILLNFSSHSGRRA